MQEIATVCMVILAAICLSLGCAQLGTLVQDNCRLEQEQQWADETALILQQVDARHD